MYVKKKVNDKNTQKDNLLRIIQSHYEIFIWTFCVVIVCGILVFLPFCHFVLVEGLGAVVGQAIEALGLLLGESEARALPLPGRHSWVLG